MDLFTKEGVVRDIAIIGGIVLLVYISRNIVPLTPDAIMSGETTRGLLAFLQGKVNMSAIQGILLSLPNILGTLVVVFLGSVFLLTMRINEIHKAEREKYAPVQTEEVEAKAKFIQWQVVLDHVNSENQAEWKLAILEADSMLDEILDDEGYIGETIGEKLKAMDPGVIHSYDDLWEAHKMRNLIAHEASTMELTKKMARDTINKFEVAFKELGHI